MTLEDQTFRAWQISEAKEGNQTTYTGTLVERRVADLPAGEVLVRVAWSSINFKDALSAAGNKGVTRNYPHTPGIDAAGTVAASASDRFQAGDEVIVIGYDLGMNTPGGFAEYIRVPASWVVALPTGLNLRQSMIIGTAGFTAALCVEKLLLNGLEPIQGPVLVTGASGGVGSFAVALLAHLGFEVVALTGSASAHDFLRELGASRIIGREDLSSVSAKPLLAETWAGAVDVAGGDVLFNVIKSLKYGASVACCGLVASAALQATVFPFILRGVNLLGVDSVNLPLTDKQRVWKRLATEWKLKDLDQLETVVNFQGLDQALKTVLHGDSRGRLVLDLSL